MTDKISNNTRIAKNTIFLFLRMVFVLFVSLYTTRVVLNTLGIIDYGIYNVVAGFVSMFAFLNSSMNNTTQRFYNFVRGTDNKDEQCKIYNTALRIQIVLAIILFIILESLGLWYIYSKMVIPSGRLDAAVWVFHSSTLSLVFLVLQIPYSAAIISHEKMDYFAIVSIFDVLIKLIVVLILPHISYDQLIFYGICLLLISITNFLLYYIYCKRHFEEIKYQKHYGKEKFKEMLTFSGWNLFGSFAYTMQGQGLNVLINAFFGPIVNAARGVTFQIQSTINGFSENIATAFRPQLVESYAKTNFLRTQNLMFSMSKYCFTMLYFLTVPIIIELHYILNIWLKGAVPDFTITFTYLVLANMLVNSLNMPISQTVQATGKVKYYQIIRSILIISTLPISWIVLKLDASPVSVFIVTLIISIINQPLSMAILHHLFYYSYKLYLKRVILPCMILTLLLPILPVTFHLIMNENFSRLIVVLISTIIASVALTYFVILNNTEKEIITSLLKKKFFKKNKNNQ